MANKEQQEASSFGIIKTLADLDEIADDVLKPMQARRAATAARARHREQTIVREVVATTVAYLNLAAAGQVGTPQQQERARQLLEDSSVCYYK